MAKKVKGFTGVKRCSAGEVYRFKNGKAKVPGVKFGSFNPNIHPRWKPFDFHEQAYITFPEFVKLNKIAKEQHGT